jgi:hypothetical protein
MRFSRRWPGETSEPVTEAEGIDLGLRKPSDLPTAGMQGAEPSPIDTAPGERCFRGRRKVGESNDYLGHSVWPVWVSEDYGSAEGRGVAGESQAGGEDLEAGRVKGTSEATQEGEVMAQ